MRLPIASRNARGNALVDRLDAGSAEGYIEFRTGSGPATPNDAPNGTLLATLPLSDPAFADFASGVGVADTVDPQPADLDGVAGYFVAYDSDDVVVEMGTVSETGDGGECQLNTVELAAGVPVEVTGWVITEPES